MAIVKKYKAQVVSLENPFDNVYTLELASKNGVFKYLPGQFLHLALEEYDPSSNWPESRCFSMQSSPKNELIKITFSVKGNFTNQMVRDLIVGKIIDIKLPFGELFQQDHTFDKVVFIAGGTGITPYLSLFLDQSFKKYINPCLYIGFRSQNYNIFHPEFEKAIQNNQTLHIQTFYEDTDGILNIDKIFEENGIESTYFISGPPAMLKVFKQILIEKGVPNKQILTDDWE